MTQKNWVRVIPFALLLAAAIGTSVLGGKGEKGAGKGGGGDQAATYDITDLGGFAGGSEVQSEATSINNPDAEGFVAVAGFSFLPNGTRHGILWGVTDSGALLGLADLGTPTGTGNSWAVAVNDDQLVVGNAVAEGAHHDSAWCSLPNQPMTALPSLGGPINSVRGLNNLGDIVGVSSVEPSVTRGAIWRVDAASTVTGPVDLGNFVPLDINDLGIMAGEEDGTAAVAWFDDSGQLVVIPIGRLAPGYTYAHAINNHNEVVGASDARAFYWSIESGILALADFGGSVSLALDINDNSEAVGWATEPNGRSHAVIWRDGVMVNLDEEIDSNSSWQLTEAYSINNSGQVVGRGFIGSRRSSELHGYLLTAKP